MATPITVATAKSEWVVAIAKARAPGLAAQRVAGSAIVAPEESACLTTFATGAVVPAAAIVREGSVLWEH